MNISELITRLEAIRAREGDLPVFYYNDCFCEVDGDKSESLPVTTVRIEDKANEATPRRVELADAE